MSHFSSKIVVLKCLKVRKIVKYTDFLLWSLRFVRAGSAYTIKIPGNGYESHLSQVLQFSLKKEKKAKKVMVVRPKFQGRKARWWSFVNHWTGRTLTSTSPSTPPLKLVKTLWAETGNVLVNGSVLVKENVLVILKGALKRIRKNA